MVERRRQVPVTTRYVATATGNDGNAGTAAAPWKTINRATQGPEYQPGDGFAVLPGTYAEEVICGRPGALGRPVSLFSAVPRGALIRPPANAYSSIRTVQPYWDVAGFDVSNPTGAGIDNTWNGSKAHHLSIHDNYIHDCGSNGIGLAWADWFWIARNEVARCAATSPYQTSGITVYQPQDNSGDQSRGWRIVAEGNWSHDNFETPVIPPNHTDGNGLIFDDFRNTQQNTYKAPTAYPYGALARWNLLTGNGGTGGHAYLSDNVTFLENTAANNNRDPLNSAQQRAALIALVSGNMKMIGNISVSDTAVNPGNFAFGFYQAFGCTMDRNMDFNRAKPGSQSILNPSGVTITNQISGFDPVLDTAWLPHSSMAGGLGAPRFVAAAASPVATLPPDVRASLNQILQDYP